ncbi:MC055R [Molluscum contagiosum virus subtype 1]|uniref:MC055R n=2 Tax=Molluscum contagiosum virus TaxID=10279 RepID=Q98223_MCV1|nr:MC055R [Molluscum contagiosum virus subtype 1]AZT86287.1 MC055R [Molluscum contagiosum virus]AAC55183.1 MC055R [Molluscum contagiosum virus subtype 1]AQY16804.1 MC055 [Molluscum contagiosum virus subtype 1]AYO88727.1 MC055 [Molluscum contagiosum virus subtype 1]QHW16796.1 MC055R [Molluscum contagiosum virus]
MREQVWPRPGPAFSATRHSETVRPLVRLDCFLYFCAGSYARGRESSTCLRSAPRTTRHEFPSEGPPPPMMTIVSVLGTRDLRPCSHPGPVSFRCPGRYNTSTFDAVGRFVAAQSGSLYAKGTQLDGKQRSMTYHCFTQALFGTCLWRAPAGYGDKSAWLSSCFPPRTQRILVCHRESFACESTATLALGVKPLVNVVRRSVVESPSCQVPMKTVIA